MKIFPDIFNDVIGPVMRGPSSSHTAASWRIATISMDILGEPLKRAIVDFDKDGAWAPNYKEQGTVMGINGGLLGLEMTDKRMKDTDAVLSESGIEIKYEVNSFQTKHANTVRLKLEGKQGNKVEIIAVSLGGGSFEIQKLNQFELSMQGDCHELLIKCSNYDESILDSHKKMLPKEILRVNTIANDGFLIHIKSRKEFSEKLITKLSSELKADKISVIRPVLPICCGNYSDIPFTDVNSLLEYAKTEKKDLGELGILYESRLSGVSSSVLSEKMENIISIIEKSITTGLKGTQYADRILPQQSHLIEKAAKSGRIPDNTIVNQIIAYVSAIMESKSAMEVIVANPTAGSCGTIGGVLKAVAESTHSSKDELIRAYFAAGITGVFFAEGIGFSAEEHACQVECGAASAMAAAGIVQLYGGTAKQAMDAASMAIQNMIGLVCDPVADRVEVPCLGKNISAAVNALTSATMSCSGFKAIIPYNEVIQIVIGVSKQMPSCVKCTGKGGLAITPTALQLKENLK